MHRLYHHSQSSIGLQNLGSECSAKPFAVFYSQLVQSNFALNDADVEANFLDALREFNKARSHAKEVFQHLFSSIFQGRSNQGSNT